MLSYTGVRDNRGRTVLNITMENLHSKASLDVALYLLNQGCGSNDIIKAKLLFAACQFGRLNMVKELIEKYEVDPNGKFKSIKLDFFKYNFLMIKMCKMKRTRLHYIKHVKEAT